MSDLGSRWSEVGVKIEALALKLRLHFQQTGNAEQASEPLDRIRDSVTGAFEAAGNAVHDDAVKSDVRDTGRLFLEALSASFAKAAEHLRESESAQDTKAADTTPIDDKPAEQDSTAATESES
jgi:hypothetical protein